MRRKHGVKERNMIALEEQTVEIAFLQLCSGSVHNISQKGENIGVSCAPR
jgi:hypothetical protein